MNKRIKKKKRNQKSLITIDGKCGNIKAYINKKHWNKGDRKNGDLANIISKDYITFDYLKRNGYESIAQVFDSKGHLEICKSWDNKNHIRVEE
jgi:hypothetical protein